ncbi:unnamed protein product [Arabidopsis thaliana]|uniref:Pectinesterase inhibitor domain-containing protein n=1 Tax=Arabidopsis thaliana TaxID=3702 RepID=A0A5S9YCT3_ARATH|nr:unnamed protein product [Arabidopsis thaliana]
MASSSYGFGVVYLAVLLPCLLVPASATKYIDAICHLVSDKAFCTKTLNAYPPATSATSTFEAAVATLHLGVSYANNAAGFAGEAAKENPQLKEKFDACQRELALISRGLKNASEELYDDTAYFDVTDCLDNIATMKNLVGKNTDKASKTIITMTLMLENFIFLAIGATSTIDIKT